MPMLDDQFDNRMVWRFTSATALGGSLSLVGLVGENTVGALVALVMIWSVVWSIGVRVL